MNRDNERSNQSKWTSGDFNNNYQMEQSITVAMYEEATKKIEQLQKENEELKKENSELRQANIELRREVGELRQENGELGREMESYGRRSIVSMLRYLSLWIRSTSCETKIY